MPRGTTGNSILVHHCPQPRVQSNPAGFILVPIGDSRGRFESRWCSSSTPADNVSSAAPSACTSLTFTLIATAPHAVKSVAARGRSDGLTARSKQWPCCASDVVAAIAVAPLGVSTRGRASGGPLGGGARTLCAIFHEQAAVASPPTVGTNEQPGTLYSRHSRYSALRLKRIGKATMEPPRNGRQFQ